MWQEQQVLLQEWGGGGAEEDLGSWGLEVSWESLADEPKHVFCVSVILLKNQVICVG